MTESYWTESPNSRPGEPLRSWLASTAVVKVDAITVVSLARARDALARIIAGEQLSLEDQVALGRLNSVSVSRWYEPVVILHEGPAAIEPAVGAIFEPLLTKVKPLGQ